MYLRCLRDFIIFGFAAYGILWTMAASFGAFFEDYRPKGIVWYGILISLSVVVGLVRCWPRNKIQIDIPASDSSFEVRFGDLFEDSNVVVIPVNEFFDGSLGDHVSENSLHGYFIKNFLGGQSTTFNRLTNRALASIESEDVQRSSGRRSRYPIGTVAAVDINEQRFLLAALTRTDLTTLKASATVHELWDCLAGIWAAIRNHSNGNCVKLPLIGSGLSGVGLPAKNLIEIIITSFLFYTKKHKIADKVTLVLTSRLRSEIDLTSIKRNWK